MAACPSGKTPAERADNPARLVHLMGRAGPVTIVALTVTDGAVTAIRTLTDPDRLAQIVPSWVT